MVIQTKLTFKMNFGTFKQNFDHSKRTWGHANRISTIQKTFRDIQTEFRPFRKNFVTFLGHLFSKENFLFRRFTQEIITNLLKIATSNDIKMILKKSCQMVWKIHTFYTF